ncbi:MAG: hypothetical protein ACK5MT_12030 [Actinomycetales bacterium]
MSDDFADEPADVDAAWARIVANWDQTSHDRNAGPGVGGSSEPVPHQDTDDNSDPSQARLAGPLSWDELDLRDRGKAESGTEAPGDPDPSDDSPQVPRRARHVRDDAASSRHRRPPPPISRHRPSGLGADDSADPQPDATARPGPAHVDPGTSGRGGPTAGSGDAAARDSATGDPLPGDSMIGDSATGDSATGAPARGAHQPASSPDVPESLTDLERLEADLDDLDFSGLAELDGPPHTGAPADRARPRSGSGAGPRDVAADGPSFLDGLEGTDEDDTYQLPDPGPLPRPTLLSALAWLGALGGPALLLFAALFWRTAPAFVIGCAVVAFIAGFVTLVVRMPDRSQDDDDGAVV